MPPQAAARMASAHDFIIGFPAGYDTYVGLELNNSVPGKWMGKWYSSPAICLLFFLRTCVCVCCVFAFVHVCMIMYDLS